MGFVEQIPYSLRFAAAMLSLFGYACLASKLLPVKNAHVPVLVASVLTLAMFMAGILNVLMPAALLLFAGGFGGFLAVAAMDRAAVLAYLKSPSTLLCLVLSCAGAALLSNATLFHFDDFSHWGSIVRDMAETNSLPADGSRVGFIGLFMSYMPTTASFVYFFDLIVGYTEGHALVGQFLMAVAAVTACFELADNDAKSKVMALPLLLVAMASLLFISTPAPEFQTLLTDTVLGLYGAASILLLISYRAHPAKSLIAAAPVMLVALCIKDAGKVFFAATVFIEFLLIAGMLVTGKRPRRSIRRAFGALVGLVAAGIALLLLWRLHVDAAFTSGFSASKFTLGLTMFDNPQMPLRHTAALVAESAFMSGDLACIAFWASNAVCAVALVVGRLRRVPTRPVQMAMAFGNAVVLATCLELVIVYAYLMPAGESGEQLAGFVRYFGCASLCMFCEVAVTVVAWLYSAAPADAVGDERKYRIASASVASAVIICVALPGLVPLSQGPLQRLFSWDRIASVQLSEARQAITPVLDPAASSIPQGSNVAVFFGEGADLSYGHYLGIYETGCQVYDFNTKALKNDDAVEWKLGNSDYLVVLGENGDALLDALERLGYQVTRGPAETKYYGLSRSSSGLEVKPL